MPAASRMRILYAHPFAQPVSGPDESLIGLLRCLRGEIEAFVALPPGSPHCERYGSAGATIIEQPMQRIRRTTNPFDLARYGGLFLPETSRFVQLIRRHKIELVHTNMEVVLQSGLAARLARVPSVYHVRGTSFASPRRVCDAVVGAINRFADEIIVISQAVGEIFYERGVRDKVNVIYNSLDPSSFDNVSKANVAALREELTGGEPNAPLVATVGRINPRKGLECFVRAAALVSRSHPQARFAVVGDAAHDLEREYLTQLRRTAEELGVNDNLVFAPARRNIAELMTALDLFVMTTINEGFGRVAIEAMAARRAVVASRVGGLPEIVEEEATGRLVAAGEAEEFAGAITELLAAPETLRRMGAAGRWRVENLFSDEANAPAVLEVYQRLLPSREESPIAMRASQT
ncbi:MAG: glycosyltransferase family 4 protein [Acidobacteriota bacterium]|nr:glycosyltransferase family 4 protein [Acidobacteriota bacterium]